MLVGSLPKQPSEADIFEFDYTPYISGRTITAITSVVTFPAGISSAGNQFFGNILQVKFNGGVTGTSYRFVIVTTITISGYGHIKEHEFDIVVLEFPNTA